MSAVDGSPVSAGSKRVLAHSLWPGPGGPGRPGRFCGRGEQLIGPVRRPWHCVLAAGVAVAVALGPCWRVHVTGITSGAVRASHRLFEVTVPSGFAGVDGGRVGCPWRLPKRRVMGMAGKCPSSALVIYGISL